jgi:hypothetical protein
VLPREKIKDHNLRVEYLKLVHDVRVLLQTHLKPTKKEPTAAPSPPTFSGKEEQKKKLSSAPKESKWELQAMQQAQERDSLRKKLSLFVRTVEPLLTIFLVLPEESAAHRLFLENVARAITRTFAPASVILYHELLFQNCKDRVFLIPISLLKKKFPHAQVHQLLKTDEFKAIALDELDRYAHDVECKRALWIAIQHLFQS